MRKSLLLAALFAMGVSFVAPASTDAHPPRYSSSYRYHSGPRYSSYRSYERVGYGNHGGFGYCGPRSYFNDYGHGGYYNRGYGHDGYGSSYYRSGYRGYGRSNYLSIGVGW